MMFPQPKPSWPRRVSGLVLALLVSGALVPVSAWAQDDILGGKVQKQRQSEAQIRDRIAALKKQVLASPKNYRFHYELGNLYAELEKTTDAQAEYEAALRLNPSYLEALVNLGGLYSDKGDHQEAIGYFERALAINPEDCKARSNLGNSYYALERYPDAMFEYRRAIEFDPKCYSALYNIAVAFADAGMYREAVQWWEKVEKAAPGTPAARSARENIKLLERFTPLPSPSSGAGEPDDGSGDPDHDH
jgi:tetratricopeptide (TPR) repeat protein